MRGSFAGVVVAAGVAAALSGPAGALAGPRDGGRWVTLGVLGGATQPDRKLADYQWDVTARAAWGARAVAGAERLAAGIRLWSSHASQRLGGSGAAGDPDVRLTSWELVGQGRVARLWGVQVWVVAGAGLVRLGYRPDRVSIASGSGGETVVELEPVTTWTASGGLAATRPLAPAWSAGVEVDHRLFELGAAHRSGDAIVTRRERFGDWSARLELARRWGRATKGAS